jgi:polyhydroxybutyrate depolymerase
MHARRVRLTGVFRRAAVVGLLVCAAAGCSDSGADRRAGGANGGSPAARATTAAAERPAPGDHSLTLQVDGRPWPYLVHAPPSYDRSRRVPVVLALHGRPSSPEAVRRLSELDDKADAAGFLAVFPRGEGKSWSPSAGSAGGRFLRSLILHLHQVWNADPRRTYLTGFSNGAAMTLQAGAELADLVAAIAPVSAGDAAPDLSALTGRTAPALVGFYGDQDRADAALLLESWRDSTGCGPPRQDKVKGIPRESARCRGGADTVVYGLPDMGHAWPGGGAGTAAEDDSPISATDLMWEFFKAHPKSG